MLCIATTVHAHLIGQRQKDILMLFLQCRAYPLYPYLWEWSQHYNKCRKHMSRNEAKKVLVLGEGLEQLLSAAASATFVNSKHENQSHAGKSGLPVFRRFFRACWLRLPTISRSARRALCVLCSVVVSFMCEFGTNAGASAARTLS